LVEAQRICSGRRPDLAIVQLGDIGGLARIFVAAQVPTLVYIHDTYTFDLATVSMSDRGVAFAACSTFVAQHMRKRLSAEISIIPVLIDPAQYRTETVRRWVTLVNPIPRKGSEIAFELAARRPDIPFVFVEAWRLRSRVQKYLEARTAHYGNVRLLSQTNDMRSVYSSTRIVLAPSLGEEAWGRVVSEGHVSGIPAISSNSGGLPEAVGPGGIVVDRNASIEHWLAALSRLWDDPHCYDLFVKHSYAHARRCDFQLNAVLDGAMSLFLSLLK
jgi:glycosyltransferase involved in cell wall biosynthesis